MYYTLHGFIGVQILLPPRRSARPQFLMKTCANQLRNEDSPLKSLFSMTAGFVLVVFASASWSQGDNPAALQDTAEFIAQKERDVTAGQSSLAPIRSASDLKTYLQSGKGDAFQALSERSLKLFVESLVFTERGLASYRFRELESELTPRQAFELLSLFGVQKTVGYLRFPRASAAERDAIAKLAPIFFDDHKGYRCFPPATCVLTSDHICIGANCGMYPP